MGMEEKLTATARNVLYKYLGVRKKTKVLLINDHLPNSIYDAFRKALDERGIACRELMLSPDRKHSEPIYEAQEEMLKARVIIAPTEKSITHAPETKKASLKGAKIISMPGVTEEIFLKINEADFEGIEKIGRSIVRQLKGKSNIHLTTPHGTDISFSIKKRPLEGLWQKTGGFVRNLPNGEIFCAPIEESADGEIVIDYWKDVITPNLKAWVKVENGRIAEWNKAAEPYVKEHSVEGGLIIAEFGIGTNKAHKKAIGNILHDEKIYGSVHIAFGNNSDFGGKNTSPIHSDVILLNPTVIVDNKKLEW